MDAAGQRNAAAKSCNRSNIAGRIESACAQGSRHLIADIALEGFERCVVQIEPARTIIQSSQILRKAGTAKRESGLQVSGGNVKLAVLAQRVHHFVRVDAQLLTDCADLVGERDLYCMKRVARLLDHLRRSQRHQAGLHAERRV